jgi:hypothetical protein
MRGEATGTILNDDPLLPAPLLSVAPITVTEGTGTSTRAIFTLDLSRAYTEVDFATADGTAVAGETTRHARALLCSSQGKCAAM